MVCVFPMQMADADDSRQNDDEAAKTGDGARQSTSELPTEAPALFALSFWLKNH